MSPLVAMTQDTRVTQPSQTFEGHTDWVYGIMYLPEGQRIVTYSRDGSLRVWNLQTGKQIARWEDGGGSKRAIALSPDEKTIVSGSDDSAVRLWDVDTGRIISKWTGHTVAVSSVCWNRSGERVVSGSWDGTARVWDVKSGRTVLEIETGFSAVGAATYSPDTTMIATGGSSLNDEQIQIWNANTGKLVANLKGHTSRVNCLTWTVDGRKLISGSSDSSIRTWNTTTWQQIAALTDTNNVYGIAISPNGRILASASHRTARLWNLENGQLIGSPIPHSDWVNRVSFSTDGNLLATGCDDHNAYTWDISDVIREASLLADGDESPLKADATRRPGQPREHSRRLPPGFLNESRGHPHSSQRPISPRSSPRDTSSRLRFLEWARNPFFHQPRRRNDEGIELRENNPEIVDVPFGVGNPRYYAASELPERKREKQKQKARKMKNAKNASSGRITQQSAGAPQAQSFSQPHPVLSAMSTIPAVYVAPAAIGSATSLPNASVSRTGWWTRFICCASAEDTNIHQ